MDIYQRKGVKEKEEVISIDLMTLIPLDIFSEMSTVNFVFPLKNFIFFAYHFFILQAFKAGKVGFIWSWSRVLVMKLAHYKSYEMELFDRKYHPMSKGPGKPDLRVKQY